MRRRLLGVLVVASFACKGDDGGDGGTGDTTGAGSFESTFGHSASDPSNPSSTTFTNSSDPSTTDPVTTDPVTTDPVTTDPVTTDPTTTDPTGTTTGDTSDTIDPSTSSDPTNASESDTSNPGGACCEVQDMPGCGDANVEACVCASESFCCDVEWDVVCTVQTVLLGCAECPGIGGDGDCCAEHGNPGCDDEQVEQCVCNEDYVCCVDPWDDICVDIAMNVCAAC
jgi:hypothetical protein